MAKKATWEYTEELTKRGGVRAYKFVAKKNDANEAIDLDAEAYAWLRDIYGERRAKAKVQLEWVQHKRTERDRFNQIYSVCRYRAEHFEVTVRFVTEVEALAFQLAFC